MKKIEEVKKWLENNTVNDLTASNVITWLKIKYDYNEWSFHFGKKPVTFQHLIEFVNDESINEQKEQFDISQHTEIINDKVEKMRFLLSEIIDVVNNISLKR
jgi:hypothetical protein